jgi:hypothetical protein
MRWIQQGLLIISILGSCASANAQDQEVDSLLMAEIEGALTFEDSLSIFTLIDSILQYGDITVPDQLGIRIGYNSNVLSAGRTLGIENFGLSPGLSYYHHTGLYADVSGFWSKDFDPSYYLTVASIGYIGSFSRWFSVMAGYDRYFYTNSKDFYIPFKNTLSVAPMFNIKPILFSINYSFYFGDDHVHRIMPNINLILVKRNLFKIERITLAPAAYMLLGNQNLIDIEFVAPRDAAEGIRNLVLYRSWYKIVESERSVFGIMNYTFSLPLTISHRNWSFMFSYSYNIPKALPDEPLTISESSYLSGSLMYFINFRRNKSPL